MDASSLHGFPMRSFNLLVTSLAFSLAVQTAGAQRATVAVSARILPSSEALAAGQIAPRMESGHAIAASARMSDVVSIPVAPLGVRTVVAKDYAEFRLAMKVSANVHYQIAVSSNVDQAKIQKQTADGRQQITYRVPTTGSQAPAAMTVTLTAASIS